jgi:hypothetical protein
VTAPFPKDHRMTTPPPPASPEKELNYHTYVSNVIPWYVRLMWLVFWIFATAYVIKNFLPAIQTELLTPP